MSGCSLPQNNNSRHLQIHECLSWPGSQYFSQPKRFDLVQFPSPKLPNAQHGLHQAAVTSLDMPQFADPLLPLKNRGAEIPCHRSSSEIKRDPCEVGAAMKRKKPFWALRLASYISRHRTTANDFDINKFCLKSKQLYKCSSQSRHMFDTWIDIEIVWNCIGIEWIQTCWVPMVPHCPTCPRYPIQSPSKTRETLLGATNRRIMRKSCFPDT